MILEFTLNSAYHLGLIVSLPIHVDRSETLEGSYDPLPAEASPMNPFSHRLGLGPK